MKSMRGKPRTRPVESAPRVACTKGVNAPGPDDRATGPASYRISPRLRKRVQELSGWRKTVAGLRRSRYRGRERTQAWGDLAAGTCQLPRPTRPELAGAYRTRALEVEALEYIAPTTPGGPLCRIHSPNQIANGCEVVFKGGQVGRDSFFIDLANGVHT